MTTVPAQQPMEPSLIVSTGWRLYRAHFKAYALISLRATAWAVVPALLALVVIVVMVGTHVELFEQLWDAEMANGGNGYSLADYEPQLRDLAKWLALAIPVWFVATFYCAAQSLGDYGGISRSAYQNLCRVDEPLQSTLRVTRSRKFSLLKAYLLQGVILLGMSLGAMGMVAIAGVGIFLTANNSAGDINVRVTLLWVLCAIAFLMAAFALYIWCALRLMLIEPPLMIEQKTGAIDALKASWRLTKGHLGHSFLVILLVYLINLGLSMAAATVLQMIAGVFWSLHVVVPESPVITVLVCIGGLIYVLLSLAPIILIAPLWRAVFAVLYFDLKNRSA